jgi:hypothetical protein
MKGSAEDEGFGLDPTYYSATPCATRASGGLRRASRSNLVSNQYSSTISHSCTLTHRSSITYTHFGAADRHAYAQPNTTDTHTTPYSCSDDDGR